MTDDPPVSRPANTPLEKLRALAPGLLLCFTIAAAATFLANHYGAPVMLFALLLGMAFHFLIDNASCAPGVEFTAKRLLRIGVGLLGVSVTLDQILSLGAAPLLLMPLLVLLTIGFGVAIAVVLKRGAVFGLLTGGAVAICGASAALAIAAVLPGIKERDTLFTVVSVTTLSTLAMIIYPIAYAALGLSDAETGLLLGGTIHDVAQVVGAGYAVSKEAGEVATYVKLLRVAMLPVVVLTIAILALRGAGRAETAGSIPWFAVGFAILLGANSLGWIPPAAAEALGVAARWLLVAAIAALGVKTSLQAMASLGGRHLGVVVGETLFLMGAAVAAAMLFPIMTG